MNIGIIIKNKVMIYLVSRYFTYFIQFVTSLVIAVKLGPYYMGIWGFVLLLVQYFQQFHFGIANSFNVLYIHHRDNQQQCNNYIGNSLVLLGYLAIIVVVLYIYYIFAGIESFEKYHADKYIVWICIIAILQYYVQFFMNLFRVKNKLNHVTFCLSIVVFLNFICIFLFKEEQLIAWLVGGYVVGNLLCVVLALASGDIPLFSQIHINFTYQKQILKKGIFLFLYNSCFYFIIISIRTIISDNYSVEEFGLFTFSFTLAHAILLILEAFSFIIFPKVISKLSSKVVEEVESTISLLRTTCITSAHLLIYLALICFPALLYFMPKYGDALTSLNLIALTILMSTSSFSYLELLISRNKEKLMATLSASALVLNCILALLMVKWLHVTFSYVIIATMITYYLYTLSILISGRKSIGKSQQKMALAELMPMRLSIPYLVALVLSVMQLEAFIWLPAVLFIFFNWKMRECILDIVKKMITKPDVVNLK